MEREVRIETFYGHEIIVSGHIKEGIPAPDRDTQDDNDKFVIEEINEIIDDKLVKTDRFHSYYIQLICDDLLLNDSERTVLLENDSRRIMNFDKYFSFDEREYIEHLLKSELIRPSTDRSDSAVLVSLAKKMVYLGFCYEEANYIENFHDKKYNNGTT